MKRPLSCTYFPFTSIAARLVETLSLCFYRVTVYQPVGSTPAEGLRPWIDNRLLDFRTPFEGIIDKKALLAALNDWQRWSATYQDADLAYLKNVGSKIAPVDPLTPKLVSKIKGTSGKTKGKSQHRDFALQLFLHMAQDFDQQSGELVEQLKEFKLQEQALQDFFRIDKLDETEDLVSAEPFVLPDKDLGSFMVENRTTAWNYMFQKDPVEPSLLLTDSPSCHAFVLDSVKEKVNVLNLEISYVQAPDVRSPWKDKLHKLFHKLLTTPWNDQVQQHIEQEAYQIEVILERQRNSSTKTAQDIACFHWYLVPQQSAGGLLNQRCGVDDSVTRIQERITNAIVGLLEYDRSS